MKENVMSESGIFKASVKLPPEQRAGYLDQACASNAELRHEIDSLLRAHDASGDFLQDHSSRRQLTPHYEPITERPGTTIGPYKLLQQIGAGGFGVVYMAEQERPVRRMVALKIIKPGMDTAQVIARFESERQALALMDHPTIAKVLDAGATDSGHPYFVMELVKGVAITEFCDKNHMPAEGRPQAIF
jgi:eukaryotic-like serine/threonine-protein kinase